MSSNRPTDLRVCPFCGSEVRFHGVGIALEDCDGCHHIYCPSCKVMVDYSAAADPNNSHETLDELRAKIVPWWNRRIA